MHDLVSLIGKEVPLAQVAGRLFFWAKEQRAPAYGALHVACSDESENECTHVFARHFAESLLPGMKCGQGALFRMINLGGRYEWGGIQIAESHYAVKASAESFKIFLAKVNAHVAVMKTAAGLEFGHKRRYDHDSAYCGALHALLQGARLPAVDELHECFVSEGRNLVAVLRDPAQVPPRFQALCAAILQARLQARRVVQDLQNMTQRTPTLFLVVPCVTFNRDGDDGELVCGLYRADLRSEEPAITYQGLGDDPARYEIMDDARPLRITDDQVDQLRTARDHRKLLVEQWREQKRLKPLRSLPKTNDAVSAILAERAEGRHADDRQAKAMLGKLVTAMARFDPATAALVLFGEGVIGICHVAHMYRVARGREGGYETRRILQELDPEIDTLPEGTAERFLEKLLGEYEQA